MAGRKSSLRPAPASAPSVRQPGARSAGDSLTQRFELHLLNGFELVCDDAAIPLPLSVQRLLAFLAFHDRPLQRVYVAGKLWLETTEGRAFANLRSTVWRAQKTSGGIVAASSSQVALAPTVSVDLHEATWRALRIVDGSADEAELGGETTLLARELLPDWYEDWVLLERERHRQLALHALDTLALRLTALGRFGEAAEAALTAIAGEPLRESAHRVLLEVHLAEGNSTEALRHFEVYRRIVLEQLGLEPSPRMLELVDRAHAALTTR